MINKEKEPITEITDIEIKVFEKELEEHRCIAALSGRELSYYGIPFSDFTPKEKIGKFVGLVKNEILGGVHWSVVDYCFKKGVLGKDKVGMWYVIAEVLEKRQNGACVTKAYDEFMRKWSGLKDLKNRRVYAKQMEDERQKR